MLLRRDCTADPLLCPHRPELRERSCTFNRRLVDALASEELVRAFSESEVAFGRPGFPRREDVVGFDDVVLYQGIACPTIEREIPRPFGVIGTRVSHSAFTVS